MAWFPNCGDDDDFPDPDYGVFGDNRPPPIQPRDLKREKAAEHRRKQRENERRVSSDFNRHMIDLFNVRNP